jgi:hypothetical protein
LTGNPKTSILRRNVGQTKPNGWRLLYILGVRERSDKLVRELVRDDAAPFVPLVASPARRHNHGFCSHHSAAADSLDHASLSECLCPARRHVAPT